MKISIITATYNSEETIEFAIESVLNQDYNEIEYIIIDGASRDSTLERIKKYESKISKIISEPDSGIYDALNKGLEQATGDVVAFLHADDYFESSDVVSKYMHVFNNSNSKLVYGDLNYVNKLDIKKVIRYWKSGNFKRNRLSFGWMPPHPALFVAKSLYDQVGLYNLDYRIAGDYDMILRLFSKVQDSEIAYIPEVTYSMRVGGASNRSLKAIIKKSTEDLMVLRSNNMGLFALFFKNISKIGQFIWKS